MNRLFRLYPVEQHWWSFNDYGAVVDVVRELRPQRVLEFGPGSSTLALIEGGAHHIACAEDDRAWADVYAERLEGRFGSELVRIHRYDWSDPITLGALDEQAFDLALIDGPYTTPRRPPAIRYAMDRCAAVLVPTEDHGRAHSSHLRPLLAELAAARGWSIEIRETGPLSGGFALLRRPLC